MVCFTPFGKYTVIPCVLVMLCSWSSFGSAQMTQDQAVALLMNSARKAYNEKDYPFATARFREMLARYSGHPEAPAARYGLALVLIDGPEAKYAEARDLLTPLAGDKNRPEYPTTVYYLALAHRGLGLLELEAALAKPNESAQRNAEAKKQFDLAAPRFAEAVTAFTGRVKTPPGESESLPVDLEWAARARCDQAEMELRTEKLKEAQASSLPFLKDAVLSRSRYRDLGRYYHGYASFLLGDLKSAQPTLSLLDPFQDPVYGTHARYLLARTHHLSDERAEAAFHYQGVVESYGKMKQEAVEGLKKPEIAKDLVEKARLESLTKGPAPEHIGRASFYWGVLLYEAERFGEAQERFATLPTAFPGSALLADAQLRLGFCQVQLKQFPQAIQTLTPLVQKEPRLADQALFWMGKAKVGAAPDATQNLAGHQQALREGVTLFQQAAERAKQMSADPLANGRRGAVLLEMGDVQQQLTQYKEAVATYQVVLTEKLLPQREEEVAYRRVMGLQLSKDYNAADEACKQFQTAYPKSTLLGAVLFRYAENNSFRAQDARNNANLPNRVQALGQLDEETIKRYQKILTDYPEHPQVNLARHAIALSHYHRGEIEKARAMFEAIPAADRIGELAIVPYLHADCILRMAPTTIPEDALEAGQLEDQLKSAATLLEGFTASQPKAAVVADALLKLGLCQQRRAEMLVEPTARQQMLTQARTVYEQLMQPAFAQQPAAPQAIFERARCMHSLGDVGGAINELRRFTTNPLQNAFIAPMARLHLALLLRRQNQAVEAVNVLAATRQQYEPTLRADKGRDSWVSLIRFHHGLALEETNKLADARGVYDSILKEYAAGAEAPEAALHLGQCLLEEGRQSRDAAAKARTEAKTPEQQTAAAQLAQQALATITQGVQFLEGQATQLGQKDAKHPTRAQMIYQIAWGYRDLAEPEVAAARAKLTEELAKKLNLDQHKLTPPAVPLEQVPLQPSEQKARAQYQALIQAFPDLPLAAIAAFEVAELFAQRKEFDQAVQYLVASLDREPPEELTEQLRIRLGDVFLRQGKHAEALAQFEAVLANPKTKQAAQAHYRAGETLMDQTKWADAEKHLAVFRDQGPFQNVAGVSDRALLRLGQAYANLNDWNRSRQAYETLVGRFGNSPWVDEGHYGIGWAWQQLKQYDQAATAYAQVTARTASETAARAQLQIGRCRFAQGRHSEASTALLVVPFTYDFPDLSAVALLEAAVALDAMKETGQAVRLLERVVRNYPDSKWAEAANERLKGIQGK